MAFTPIERMRWQAFEAQQARRKGNRHDYNIKARIHCEKCDATFNSYGALRHHKNEAHSY